MTLRQDLREKFEIDAHPLTLSERVGIQHDGMTLERLTFATKDGERARGFLLRPPGDAPVPAILYIHAHGNAYDIGADELLDGRKALLSPLGPEFARRGFAVLMIELPAFGARSRPGESARAKAALWNGQSLAGQMLGEQAAAFDWLASRPDIIAERIAVFGISMGATFSYWLAAAEPRIAASAHLCAYADYAALITAGNIDLHGIYLTVPGLLGLAGNGEIAGLIAPRPQLIGIGDLDPLTPPAAFEPAFAQTRRAYEEADATDRLVLVREPKAGHVETPAMRAAVFTFLDRHIGLA
ncbi:alpha/beta hydrolase family protein [Martelella soudanensis]|uniref:alpha/beta hydrolase family protein n=1 Tax=unclassified Martelella TaxID=2629616 RepID=UPI001FEE8D71|nr:MULTISPECIES: CocE/NonD family hydrolase [unclassified Martelella]